MNDFAKIARQKAKDPEQEKLREHKDVWNDVTSLLIAKLIAFKRGLNGAGDPRAEIPSSKITEPLPEELKVYLDSIVSDYSDVINGAKFIMQEQKEYSREHETKKEKISSQEYKMVVEASNALTRAWARIGLLGHPEKNARIGILNTGGSILPDLRNLEYELTSRNEKSSHARVILDLHNILSKVHGSMLPLVKSLTKEIEQDNSKKKDKPEQKGKEEKVYEEAAPVHAGQQMLQQLDKVKEDLPELEAMSKQEGLEQEVDELIRKEFQLRKVINEDPLELIVKHKKMLDDLLSHHKEIISKVKGSDTNKLKLSSLNAFNQKCQEIEKTAHNAVTRWINRKLLEIYPGKNGIINLRAVKELRNTFTTLDSLLDTVENKNSTAENILEAYANFATSLKNVAEISSYLGKIYINKQKTLPKGEKGLTLTKQNISEMLRDAKRLI